MPPRNPMGLRTGCRSDKITDMKALTFGLVALVVAGCATTDCRRAEPRTVREPVRVVISPTGGLSADFGAAYDGDVQVKASGPNWGSVTLKAGERTEIFTYTGAEEDTFVLRDAKGVRYVQAECTMLSELNPGSVLLIER